MCLIYMEFKRSFSFERLDRLASILIWVFTIFFVISFLIRTYNLEYGFYSQERVDQQFSHCIEYLSDPTICLREIKYRSEYLEDRDNALILMFMLPIVFYGSKYLYKYLFPKSGIK